MGGFVDKALEFAQVSALMTAKEYPYTGVYDEMNCRFDNNKGAGEIQGINYIQQYNATQLKQALITAPVAASVEASNLFQQYKSGVITNNCGQTPNHDILIVGYGTEKVGTVPQEYFLVKNSWGADWGENGYVKISTSSDDICGILKYPLMANWNG